MKRFKQIKDREDGNLFITYLMMFLLMMGIFGVAVDSAVSIYARNSIQLALDGATLTAATRTNAGGGQGNLASLNQAEVCAQVWTVYSSNRPGVATAGVKPSAPYTQISCVVGTDNRATSSNNQGSQYVEVSIKETRRNYFLQALGLDTQEFNITSRSRLATSIER